MLSVMSSIFENNSHYVECTFESIDLYDFIEVISGLFIYLFPCVSRIETLFTNVNVN